MNEPVVGVLALQGDVREHIDVLRACAPKRCECGARPSWIGSTLVIPGGESTTMDKLVRGFDLYEPLRERIKRGLPVLGSCAGMIMLADRIVDAPPDSRRLADWMSPSVAMHSAARSSRSKPTSSLRVSMTASRCTRCSSGSLGRGRRPRRRDPGDGSGGPAAGRIVAVQQGALLATSFHPEISGDPRVHRLFLDRVKESPAHVRPSKWATTRHKKAVVDARRGKLFAS